MNIENSAGEAVGVTKRVNYTDAERAWGTAMAMAGASVPEIHTGLGELFDRAVSVTAARSFLGRCAKNRSPEASLRSRRRGQLALTHGLALVPLHTDFDGMESAYSADREGLVPQEAKDNRKRIASRSTDPKRVDVVQTEAPLGRSAPPPTHTKTAPVLTPKKVQEDSGVEVTFNSAGTSLVREIPKPIYDKIVQLILRHG